MQSCNCRAASGTVKSSVNRNHISLNPHTASGNKGQLLKQVMVSYLAATAALTSGSYLLSSSMHLFSYNRPRDEARYIFEVNSRNSDDCQ